MESKKEEGAMEKAREMVAVFAPFFPLAEVEKTQKVRKFAARLDQNDHRVCFFFPSLVRHMVICLSMSPAKRSRGNVAHVGKIYTVD